MTLASLLPLAPYAALVVAVNGGGVAAKAVWSRLAESSIGPLSAVGRAALATMRMHPAVVGMLLGALPYVLPGPLAQRVAVGLVLGEFAETLYTDGRAAMRRMLGARASRPPEAGWASVDVAALLVACAVGCLFVALLHVFVTRTMAP